MAAIDFIEPYWIWNIIHFITRNGLLYTATCIEYGKSVITNTLNIVQGFTITPAKALGTIDASAQITVPYRIGNQKYMVVLDKEPDETGNILYAAFELEPDHILLITDLFRSIYGPNEDFHERPVCPIDILKWFFTKEQDTFCTAQLTILAATSNANNRTNLIERTIIQMNDYIPCRLSLNLNS